MILGVLSLASAEAPKTPKLAELIFWIRMAAGYPSVASGDLTIQQRKMNLWKQSAELSCFRHGGKVLTGTEAFCLQAMAMSPGGLLDVSTDWLKVVEWSTTQIIATDDSSICLTSQTIFDLKRKTVIALDIRKPEAQGLAGACNLIPDRQTYYLQDKADYFAQKSLAAK